MRPARRILGLPVDAALIIAGVLVVLALFAGVVIPGARRRDRARDGGRTAATAAAAEPRRHPAGGPARSPP